MVKYQEHIRYESKIILIAIINKHVSIIAMKQRRRIVCYFLSNKILIIILAIYHNCSTDITIGSIYIKNIIKFNTYCNIQLIHRIDH